MSRVIPFPTAVALTTQPGLVRRWSTVPNHRILDEKFAILSEGIRKLEQRNPNEGYPFVIQVGVAATVSIGAGAVTGATVAGLNLHGFNLGLGSLTIGTVNGALTLETAVPGAAGVVTFDITDTGAALAVTADRDAGTVSVVHNGDTATDIAAAINGDAAAKYMLNVTAGGTGADTPPDTVATEIVGATSVATFPQGSEVNLMIGGQNLVGRGGAAVAGWGVTEWTTSSITFDFNPTDADGGGTDLTADTAHAITLLVEGLVVPLGFLNVVA